MGWGDPYYRWYELCLLIGVILNDLAIIAAIPLLATALPSRRERPIRRQTLACVLLAIVMLFTRNGFRVYWLVKINMYGPRMPMYGPRSAAWDNFSETLLIVAILLEFALKICAALYLVFIGTRLSRTGLGIVAACGLLPSALGTLPFLVYPFFRLTGLHIPLWPDLTSNTAETFHFLWLTLVWSAIALFAAILALRQPR